MNLEKSPHKQFLFLLVGISVIRLFMLLLSPLNLHGDEAQYWYWSRSFDWGYFSKPPMIAWLIGATTSIFGNGEWAVRLSSILIHPITAYILFRTGQFLYDARTGFWAGALYFLMPAVWLSSGIVSTDVALLLFWALALNAWAHIRETPNIQWAVLLGIAIGLGFLSKYAMVFFLIALSIGFVFDSKIRRALRSWHGLLMAAIAGTLMAPNIIWNARHDFATLSHTAANANIQKNLFHPLEFLEFTGSQFLVFGPIAMMLLILALYSLIKKKADKTALFLSFFTLVPLLVICAESLLSRANANWAVNAYISGSLLAARFGIINAPLWLGRSFALRLLLGIFFTIAVLSPPLVNALGQANAVKHVRGWPQTNALVKKITTKGYDKGYGKGYGRQNYSAIAVDNRLLFFELSYYGLEKDTGLPLHMWLNTNHATHHAEAVAPLPASKTEDGPVLIINYYWDCPDMKGAIKQACLNAIYARGKIPFEEKFKSDFKKLEELKPLLLDLGGGKTRKLRLWAGYGYTPTTANDR
ncbi:MAG: glycosyltransferase family 39 protein [Robiginitomaculum sp.]